MVDRPVPEGHLPSERCPCEWHLCRAGCRGKRPSLAHQPWARQHHGAQRQVPEKPSSARAVPHDSLLVSQACLIPPPPSTPVSPPHPTAPQAALKQASEDTPLLAGDWSRCGPLRLEIEVSGPWFLSLPKRTQNQKKPAPSSSGHPPTARSPELLRGAGGSVCAQGAASAQRRQSQHTHGEHVRSPQPPCSWTHSPVRPRAPHP